MGALVQSPIAKGPRPFKVKWVKGHATEAHVQASLITHEDRVGNHRADAIADIGSQVHGDDIITIMGALTNRFKGYVSFMRKVAHHIVEAYQIHRAMIAHKDAVEARREANIDKRSAYQELAYPVQGETVKLKPVSSVEC